MDKFFHITERGSTVRTEISAGVISFLTMSYIVALNPNLLTNFGAEGQGLWNAVFMATCISAALGTVCMGLLANQPFALAPGMGLNSFFAVIVADVAAMTGMSYLRSFRAGLTLIFLEGCLFLLLSLFSVREKLIAALPLVVRRTITPAVGMMLLNIALGSNAGVFTADGQAHYVLRDFFGSLTSSYARSQLGDAWGLMVLTTVTMLFGAFLIAALNRRGVRSAVLLGILASSCLYWGGEALFLGIDPFADLGTLSFVPPFRDMAEYTLFKLDFPGLVSMGWSTALTLIVTLCIIDMFDTVGTLVGTATRAGILREDGTFPGLSQALVSDALGTLMGSLCGTSTVTTFVESAAAVESGGRTGLSALVSGVLFLLCIFIAPLMALIPSAATSAALIYVGVLMLSNLKDLNFDDPEELLTAGIMLIAMPVAGSIGNAIGLSMIAFTSVKVLSGRARELSGLTWGLTVLFMVKFFLAF